MSAITRWRKKPVAISAWLWNESMSMLNLMKANGLDWVSFDSRIDQPDLCVNLRIRTLEDSDTSAHHVSKGDYIIKGVKGEFYACKPDIFAATYEPVGASEGGNDRLADQLLLETLAERENDHSKTIYFCGACNGENIHDKDCIVVKAAAALRSAPSASRTTETIERVVARLMPIATEGGNRLTSGEAQEIIRCLRAIDSRGKA